MNDSTVNEIRQRVDILIDQLAPSSRPQGEEGKEIWNNCLSACINLGAPINLLKGESFRIKCLIPISRFSVTNFSSSMDLPGGIPHYNYNKCVTTISNIITSIISIKYSIIGMDHNNLYYRLSVKNVNVVIREFVQTYNEYIKTLSSNIAHIIDSVSQNNNPRFENDLRSVLSNLCLAFDVVEKFSTTHPSAFELQPLPQPEMTSESPPPPETTLPPPDRKFVNLPDRYVCAICREPFFKPAVNSAGFVYCKECITASIRSGNRRDPLTNESITSSIIECGFIKREMDEYLEK